MKDYFLPLLPSSQFYHPREAALCIIWVLSHNANVSLGSWGLGLLGGDSLTLAAGNTHGEENLLSSQYQTPFRQEACLHPLQKPPREAISVPGTAWHLQISHFLEPQLTLGLGCHPHRRPRTGSGVLSSILLCLCSRRGCSLRPEQGRIHSSQPVDSRARPNAVLNKNPLWMRPESYG